MMATKRRMDPFQRVRKLISRRRRCLHHRRARRRNLKRKTIQRLLRMKSHSQWKVRVKRIRQLNFMKEAAQTTSGSNRTTLSQMSLKTPLHKLNSSNLQRELRLLLKLRARTSKTLSVNSSNSNSSSSRWHRRYKQSSQGTRRENGSYDGVKHCSCRTLRAASSTLIIRR